MASTSPSIDAPGPAADAAARQVPVPEIAGARSFHGTVSRTWELELIISGAVLFGLFHLPGLADAWFDRTLPLLARQPATMALLGVLLLKGLCYWLFACFVIHLFARALWVALIGLESVFPHGIRWEKQEIGPILSRLYRQNATTLPRTVARLDALCSTLFSVGFFVAFLFAYWMLVGGLALLIGGTLSRVFRGGEDLLLLSLAAYGLLVLPFVLLAGVDAHWGARIAEGSLSWRFIHRGLRLRTLASGFPLIGGVMLTLSTNVRHWWLVGLGTVLVTIGVTAELQVRGGQLRVGFQEFFPEAGGAHTLHTVHYESMRSGRDRFALAPSIQGDVIEDPFVRLFIPYRVERHNLAIAELCPGVPRLRETGLVSGPAARPDDAAGAAVLRCVERIHGVTLNGEPLAEPSLHFFTHPTSGLPGFVAYIPTAELPRGRNELRVAQVPRLGARASTAEPPEPFVIPFWR